MAEGQQQEGAIDAAMMVAIAAAVAAGGDSSNNSSGGMAAAAPVPAAAAAGGGPPAAPAPSAAPGGRGSKLDPDVAVLSLQIDSHMQALTQSAVEHLLAVKGRMQAALQAAVDEEHADGAARTAGMQAELDATSAALQATQGLLTEASTFVDRLSAGYAAKHAAVRGRANLLRCFYLWREWAHNKRRLQHLALRLQQWYVQRWLLGRAWDRWAGQARLQYRTLVAERAERQRRADAAELQAAHAAEVAALRAELGGLEARLADEAAARAKMEEEMKRAFMRGVTAINLEALTIMRRGAPPTGANPFPVPVPLTTASAAAGITAAASAAAAASGGAADCLTSPPAVTAGTGCGAATMATWAVPDQGQQQQQPDFETTAPGGCYAAVASPFAAPGQAWAMHGGARQDSIKHPALGSLVATTSAFCGGSHQRQQQQSAAAATAASMPPPRVHVERGPAAAAASSPSASKGGPSRVAGARRAVGGAQLAGRLAVAAAAAAGDGWRRRDSSA